MEALRRRVPTQTLRGVDPITLEVLVGGLIDKPLGQVSPVNVADLCALAELGEQPPPNVRRRLAFYRQRIAAEIADLPNGPELAAVVEEWKQVPAARMPLSLRQAWAAELERPSRTFREVALLQELVNPWEGVQPEPFAISTPKPAGSSGGPKIISRPAAEPSSAAPRQVLRAERAPKEKAATPSRKDESPEDKLRTTWIREICLERLANATDNGLLETVLIAGVRHRGRENYPTLQPTQITTVLRDMERVGMVRSTAGRWLIAARHRH